MTPHDILSHPATGRLTLTLLHFFWQGLLVWAFVAELLHLLLPRPCAGPCVCEAASEEVACWVIGEDSNLRPQVSRLVDITQPLAGHVSSLQHASITDTIFQMECSCVRLFCLWYINQEFRCVTTSPFDITTIHFTTRKFPSDFSRLSDEFGFSQAKHDVSGHHLAA